MPRRRSSRVECTEGSGSGRILSANKIKGPDLADSSRPRYTRRVCVRGNKSVIEHPPPWQPLMETRPCVGRRSTRQRGCVSRSLPSLLIPPPEPYVALRSFLTSPLCRCFPLSSWLGFKPEADSAATTISIHRAGNKANDLWRRFIAVFIAAPSPPYRPAVQVRAGRIRLHRDKGMQFLVHRCL